MSDARAGTSMNETEIQMCLRESIPTTFSGVVSIAAPGRAIVTEAWGLAYRPERVASTPSTRFGIASGTKGFTATAVLNLASAGYLDISARVVDLLPGAFPHFDETITVRHLLTHTSGIPDYCDEEDDCDFEAIWRSRPVYAFESPADFAPLFSDLPAKFPPGERFGYSNSGYIVLGMILESVTRRPFHRLITETVFDPFGMDGAGFFRPDELPAHCALGYMPMPDGGWRSNIFAIPVVGGPDGGAYVTARDMHNYWTRLLGSDTTNAEVRDLILDTDIPAGDPNAPETSGKAYSLGHWVSTRWDKNRFFYLTGQDPGVSFVSGFCPDDGRCFTILANTEDGLDLTVRSVLELIPRLG